MKRLICRTLIKRLNTENALLKSSGGKQEDYVLNNILLGASDQEYKPLVIIGSEKLESYGTVRDMLLRAKFLILLKVVDKKI